MKVTAIENVFVDGRFIRAGTEVDVAGPSVPSWAVASSVYRAPEPRETVAAGASSGFMRNSTFADKRRNPSDDSRGARNPQRAVEVGVGDPRHAWRF